MKKLANIILTEQPISKGWQAENLVQVVDDIIYVYLPQGIKASLRQIQQAARSIEKLGVSEAKLQGDNWDEASQWIFALGFTCVGKLSAVEFTGSGAVLARLNDKLNVRNGIMIKIDD